MIEFLGAIFIASIAGSIHCAGMCGGLVAMCVDGRPVNARSIWSARAMYHCGRLVTYTALGAACGALGAAIDLGGAQLGVSRLVAWIAGGLMIAIAVVTLLRVLGVRLPGSGGGVATRWTGRLLGLLRGVRASRRSAVLGLLTGLLPCGWLYAFCVAAAGTGSPLLGAATMAVFWLGTVPILVALALGLQSVARPLCRHLPTVTALSLLVLGTVTIFGRLAVPTYADTLDGALAPTSNRDLVVPDAETPLPCCDDDADSDI